MIGPNHGIPVHISKLEAFFPVREHFSYPYFFSRQGSVHASAIASFINPIIGNRIWGYYLPPSYSENSYKTYKTFFVPDLSPVYMELYRFSFDDIFVGQAIAEEVVLVRSNDYSLPNSDGRVDILNTDTGYSVLLLYNGDWSDNCAGCIPANVTGREYVF